MQTKTLRKYKDKPKRKVNFSIFKLDVKIDNAKEQQHIKRLG
jgi:hypothetical protein